MRFPVRASFLVLVAACATEHRAPFAPDGAPSFAREDNQRQKQIAVLRDGQDPAAVARAHGLTPVYVYRRVLNGFAGSLTAGQQANLAADPRVLFVGDDRTAALIEPVEPEAPLQAFTVPEPLPQIIPPNMIRVGVDASATADVDGVDEGLDVDIGILDTGIDLGHPELHVFGGRRFVNGPGSDFEDCFGHGSHVAGIAAARDNERGVVGVAPGARLWSLRVFQCGGVAFFSDIIAALDFSVEQGIEVVNMSLGGGGRDDGNCGLTNRDAFHLAVCRTVEAGVTVVVAAGNSAADAAFTTPAAYDEVITVSAIGSDDALASFSNFGADVDIAAPGVRILSTYLDGQYIRFSGTSMASPHVAGAAALLIASSRHRLSPADVKRILIQNARGVALNDPDGDPDPVVYVGRF